MEPLAVFAGTRPEIIKMAPVIRALRKHGMPYVFIHCGQHYDYEMSQKFIEDLELPPPDYCFKLKARTQGQQTSQIITKTEQTLIKSRPSTVLVEGDTNGVLGAALASVKLGIPVGHVEAGLRSHDLRMPEEHNRRLTDHISTYLFAPTKTSERNLKLENVWGKTSITGNTVIDAVFQHMPLALKKSRIMEQIRFTNFAVATAHRAENVDDVPTLTSFLGAFSDSPLPIVYPMHPRTRKRIQSNPKLKTLAKSKNVQILPPVGYLDFLALMSKCKMIITDSGGIQEEATAPQIRKPVLVIRLSTERPEAVETGFATVTGVEKNSILRSIRQTLNKDTTTLPPKSPYGDGTAAEKIIEILKEEIAA